MFDEDQKIEDLENMTKDYCRKLLRQVLSNCKFTDTIYQILKYSSYKITGENLGQDYQK